MYGLSRESPAAIHTYLIVATDTVPMDEDSPVTIEDLDPAAELDERELACVREGLRSEDPIERRGAARFCNRMRAENVEGLRGLVDDLAPLLEDDRVSIAEQAGGALLAVARERPEELADSVGGIVSLATREAGSIKLLGAELLRTVVVGRPEAAASDLDRLLRVLREPTGPFEASEAAEMLDDPQGRQSVVELEKEEHRSRLQAFGIFANVVVAVAEAAPSACFDHVDDLVVLLDHDDATIAGSAVDALGEVARADAAVAAPAFEPLVECLDRDDRRVRARAIRALASFDDDRAVGPLRDLAESTDDEDLAELATDTADFLTQE